MAFGINATVNLLGMMGRYAFQAAVSGMQNALNDGLGVGDAIGHYWGKLNTWSKVATIGMAGLGGYYAYCQARSIYLSIKEGRTGGRRAAELSAYSGSSVLIFHRPGKECFYL